MMVSKFPGDPFQFKLVTTKFVVCWKVNVFGPVALKVVIGRLLVSVKIIAPAPPGGIVSVLKAVGGPKLIVFDEAEVSETSTVDVPTV